MLNILALAFLTLIIGWALFDIALIRAESRTDDALEDWIAGNQVNKPLLGEEFFVPIGGRDPVTIGEFDPKTEALFLVIDNETPDGGQQDVSIQPSKDGKGQDILHGETVFVRLPNVDAHAKVDVTIVERAA